jgi:transcriptional regulator with XRE-family HTH domain
MCRVTGLIFGEVVLKVTKNSKDKTVAKQIRAVREAKGLTQANLAAQASITPAAISQIEAGARIPSTPILRRVAAVLGVSIDYLLGSTNEVQLQDILSDEGVQKFFRGYQSLSSQDQKLIQQQIEFLKSKSDSKR